MSGAPRSARDCDWVLAAGAFAATGASQLACQLLLGRMLGPEDFGEIATLLNVMNFVGVPLVALQLTVTGLVARGGSSAATLRRAAVAGLVGGLVAVLTAPWWGAGLAVTSIAACRVAALFVPATFLVAVVRGDTVGQGRTRALAGAMTVAAVGRVVATTAGAYWYGIGGAAAAAVASELLVAVALLTVVRPRGRREGTVIARETLAATYTHVAAWLVVNVDLLWARRLLAPDDAGRYLVVAGVSVGLVSFGQAFLWHRASASTDPAVGRAVVRRSAIIVASVALVGVPVAAVVMPVVLGDEFGGLTGLLALGGAWAVMASIVQTATATQLIAGRRGLARTVPLAVAAIVAPPLWVAALGDSPATLAIAAVANAAIGAAVLVAGGRRTADAAPSPQPTPRPAIPEPVR